MTARTEYGDFQTPLSLATEVIDLIDELVGTPSRVIEPTAGLGSFLEAAHTKWGNIPTYEGYEINLDYVCAASKRLAPRKIELIPE